MHIRGGWSSGHHLARAAIEVCSRIVSRDKRDKEVAILLAPARAVIAGNEEADRLAKEAAEGRTHEVAWEYRCTSY